KLEEWLKENPQADSKKVKKIKQLIQLSCIGRTRMNEHPNLRARLGEVYELNEETGVHELVEIIDVQEAALFQLEKMVGHPLPLLSAQLKGEPIVLD
ncbi:MAG TPA: hypothetical protein DCE56_02375, partial [Cyanobacteria bacterium UBA8553]|nr:hypothetical protein [Cyanobacteria bacterium UBA8553]